MIEQKVISTYWIYSF